MGRKGGETKTLKRRGEHAGYRGGCFKKEGSWTPYEL